MHGRLLSAKDLAQMQYSQKRLVMDFYLHYFLVQTLTLPQIQVKYFVSLFINLTKITFWASKLGISYPDRSCVGIRNFQAKSGES